MLSAMETFRYLRQLCCGSIHLLAETENFSWKDAEIFGWVWVFIIEWSVYGLFFCKILYLDIIRICFVRQKCFFDGDVVLKLILEPGIWTGTGLNNRYFFQIENRFIFCETVMKKWQFGFCFRFYFQFKPFNLIKLQILFLIPTC